MTAVVLIPGIISFIVLWQYSTRAALLNIYLPALLLFPVYFVWRVGGLPPVSASQAAAIPFLLFFILRHRQIYFLSRCDLWIFLYSYGGMVAEMRHTNVGNSLFGFFSDLTSIIILPLLLLLSVAALLTLNTMWRRRYMTKDLLTLALYSIHGHAQQIPIAIGQLGFLLRRNQRKQLIEYK